ncbi:hypothetical protein IB265_33280 [Ensifer sp. ENS10]|uniref:hypothetical protein n=1 Tax=Ensifer sp. ENS10 TaxID=2769286 RepID=UPI001783A1D1|nr:hypothetical protein [Ensifer sp. ENS10]MBD9511630.1 hypothetical protein [Ensifer sp. ENS10]
MFQPNLKGVLSRIVSRDVHGRATFSEPMECPFGIVNLNVGAEKTVVRADSSASRGSADEVSTKYAKILIVPYVEVKIGDKFEFQGLKFKIASTHYRISVMGSIDHIECDMEIWPA